MLHVSCRHARLIKTSHSQMAYVGQDDLHQLRQEHAYVNGGEMITCSKAATDIVDHVERSSDPFKPDYSMADNAWIGGKKAASQSGCAIL